MFSTKYSAFTVLLLILLQARLIQCAHIPARFLATKESAPSNDSDTGEQLVRRDITPPEREYLDELSSSYRGIYWEVAYPGASNENGGCTVHSQPYHSSLKRITNLIYLQIDKFNILVEATRMSIKFADYSGNSLVREDPWSNRFFVRNSKAPVGGRWKLSRPCRAQAIASPRTNNRFQHQQAST